MRLLRTMAVLLALLTLPAAGSDTPAADADLELLVRRLLPRAEQHLKRYRGFLPFGGALGLDGGFKLYVGAKPRQAEDLDKVALQVASGLRQLAERGEARAVGLVVLVRTPPPGQTEKSDAIWLRVEHASGVSRSIFYPYVLVGEDDVELGEPHRVAETPGFYVTR